VAMWAALVQTPKRTWQNQEPGLGCRAQGDKK
jgi:hypothetical protein